MLKEKEITNLNAWRMFSRPFVSRSKIAAWDWPNKSFYDTIITGTCYIWLPVRSLWKNRRVGGIILRLHHMDPPWPHAFTSTDPLSRPIRISRTIRSCSEDDWTSFTSKITDEGIYPAQSSIGCFGEPAPLLVCWLVRWDGTTRPPCNISCSSMTHGYH